MVALQHKMEMYRLRNLDMGFQIYIIYFFYYYETQKTLNTLIWFWKIVCVLSQSQLSWRRAAVCGLISSDSDSQFARYHM